MQTVCWCPPDGPFSKEQQGYIGLPDHPGLYWFYGEPFMGEMGGHYNGTIKPDMDLHLITVVQTSNSLAAHCNGAFITLRRWNGKNRGVLGVFYEVTTPKIDDLTVEDIQKEYDKTIGSNIDSCAEMDHF